MGAGQSNEEKLNMNMARSCLFDALVGAIMCRSLLGQMAAVGDFL